jgi:tetratricopeptide (TPR) repeat protein
MGRIEKTVFISYRRTNAFSALAVFQDLTHHGYDVFFDYDGIPSGDFETSILENIRTRAHFVVLLTPSALERCSDPEDWLRREIETALDEKRNIIPLMLEGFSFGTPAIADQLTGKLALLRKYQDLKVPVDYFAEAMDRLRTRFLNVALDAVPHPASLLAAQAAKTQQAAAGTAPIVQEEELSAQTYFERGFSAVDPDEKIRFYTEAIRLKPDYADAYNSRGNTRQTNGDVEGSLKDYDEAIRLKPDLANAYNNRGNTRQTNGDVEGALRDYDEAIRLKPDLALSYYNRGNTRQANGDVKGALKDFGEAIRLKPDLSEAYNNRGNARKANGDVEGALRDYDEAIRLKPDDAEAYHNRGNAREANGDVEGALRDYDEAIRLKPDYADAYHNRGTAREAKGDVEGALKDYDEAIRLKPEFAWAYIGRGNARKAKGDAEGALRDYDEAIRLKPDDDVARYNRALLEMNRSEHSAALADFQKYLDLGGGERHGNRTYAEQFIRDLKAKL